MTNRGTEDLVIAQGGITASNEAFSIGPVISASDGAADLAAGPVVVRASSDDELIVPPQCFNQRSPRLDRSPARFGQCRRNG